jgi:hypothetical protein
MKRATMRLLSWISGTIIGIIGMIASRTLYFDSMMQIKKALLNMNFNLLQSEDFWIGLILPFIMLAVFITLGKMVSHWGIKTFCKIIP